MNLRRRKNIDNRQRVLLTSKQVIKFRPLKCRTGPTQSGSQAMGQDRLFMVSPQVANQIAHLGLQIETKKTQNQAAIRSKLGTPKQDMVDKLFAQARKAAGKMDHTPKVIKNYQKWDWK